MAPRISAPVNIRATAKRLLENGVDRAKVERALGEEEQTVIRRLLALCITNHVYAVYKDA
jgi:hypothetical protein